MAIPPYWWDTLAAPGAELGIAWLDPGSWRPADDPGPEYADSPRTIDVPQRTARDAELRAGRLLVGTGPAVPTRTHDIEQDVRWYADGDGGLWCALGPYYPAWLWVRVEPTADGLREVLSSTFPRRAPMRTELTAAARGFVGYTHTVEVPNVYDGEFVAINGHDLDRYVGLMAYPMQHAWGSAHVDDPLRTEIGAVPALSMMAATDGNLAQRLGRVPSMTWRMLQSQAYLSIEIHGRDVVCAAVRYVPTPASHRATVRRVNTDFDTAYPEDLPLDVIGALTGFAWDTEDTLAHNLGPDASVGQVAGMVRVMYALRHGDLGATLALRDYARHPEPDVRRSTVWAALWYGDHFMAYEALLAEPDAETRAHLLDVIERGLPGADTYNAFDDYFAGKPVLVDASGEPVETWRDDDEDDEDEDES